MNRGNRAFDDRNFYEVFLGVIDAFGDGVGYFIGLAQTITHHTVSIAYHHDGGETETATAFTTFRYALDGQRPFFEIDFCWS